jgi:hypothetical protein
MASTIPDAKAEEVVELWTDSTMHVSLHDGDPGKTGASELSTFGREEITSAQWAAFAADASTGGRRKESDVELSYGNAPSSEDITHFGFWTAATEGTFLGGAELVTPQSVTQGNEVKFNSGDLQIVGAGHGQTGA